MLTRMRPTIWLRTVLSSVGNRRQKRGISRSLSTLASVLDSGSDGQGMAPASGSTPRCRHAFHSPNDLTRVASCDATKHFVATA